MMDKTHLGIKKKLKNFFQFYNWFLILNYLDIELLQFFIKQ
jgi:hypothetical protein